MTEKSLRDRRKEETRDNLIRAATRLFLDKGFDNTTVEEISAAAGVSGRTFFRYFATKEALVFRNRPERLALFRNFLTVEWDFPDPFTRLKMAAMFVADFYDANMAMITEELNIVAGSPALTAENHAAFLRMERVMARSLHKMRGKTWMSRRQSVMFASAFLGAHRALVWDWVSHGCRPSLKKRNAEICSVVDILAMATLGLKIPLAASDTPAAASSSTPGPGGITHQVPAKDD